MNSTALIMWLSAITIVTGFMAFFFYKVVTTPQEANPDDEQPIPGVKSFDAT